MSNHQTTTIIKRGELAHDASVEEIIEQVKMILRRNIAKQKRNKKVYMLFDDLYSLLLFRITNASFYFQKKHGELPPVDYLFKAIHNEIRTESKKTTRRNSRVISFSSFSGKINMSGDEILFPHVGNGLDGELLLVRNQQAVALLGEFSGRELLFVKESLFPSRAMQNYYAGYLFKFPNCSNWKKGKAKIRRRAFCAAFCAIYGLSRDQFRFVREKVSAKIDQLIKDGFFQS